MSKLLQRNHESGQPSQPKLRHSFAHNHPNFLACSYLKILKEFLSKFENTSLKIKGLKHLTLASKFDQNNLDPKPSISW
jgi:hypothetical protein